MYEYKITPKAPLMFRDGKPFGVEENIADTLSFPLPSTISGAIRTAWAEAQSDNFNYQAKKKALLNKLVLGPLLTQSNYNDKGEIHTAVLFPAPADALCLNTDAGKKVYRLSPKELGKGEGTDIDNSLLPVFLDKSASKAKPAQDADKFWTLEQISQWQSTENSGVTQAINISLLPKKVRTHVAIKQSTGAAESGLLFQTAGLDFGEIKTSLNPERMADTGWGDSHYGLLSCFQEEIPSTYRTIGGEARLAHIEKTDGLWPDCPKALATGLINSTNGFRLTLVTPAIFRNGSIPSFIDSKTFEGELGPLKVRLKAMVVPRWQAGTSWDMAESGSQSGKGMRSIKRLVPAGSVYWFEIIAGHSSELIHQWLISMADTNEDHFERQNDGFGLAIPGVWDIQNSTNTN